MTQVIGTVEDAYTVCATITRTQARNFYYGIRLLPPPKRTALCALYALASTLVASRRDPWDLLRVMAVAAVANFALNLALIPVWDAAGAALA